MVSISLTIFLLGVLLNNTYWSLVSEQNRYAAMIIIIKKAVGIKLGHERTLSYNLISPDRLNSFLFERVNM